MPTPVNRPAHPSRLRRMLCAVAAAGQTGWAVAAAAAPAVQPEAAQQGPNALLRMAGALAAGLLVWALAAAWQRTSQRGWAGWMPGRSGDEGLIRAMMQHSSQLCGLLSSDGRMLRMNHVGALWMGAEASAALSRLALWEHPIWSAEPGQAHLLREAVLAAAQGKAGKLGALLLGGPGGTRQVELSLRPLRDSAGRNDGQLLLEARDVTLRRQAEEKLLLAAVVFEQAREGIVITRSDGLILSVNPAFCEITGYPAAEVEGHYPTRLMGGLDLNLRQNIRSELQRQGHWQGEIDSQRKNGEPYTACLSMTGRIGDHGQTTHLIGIVNDITLAKRTEHQLQRQAHYDPLTELPNRHLLIDRLRQALIAGHRNSVPVALLFIDLNQFRNINEHFGHQAGDSVLLQLARRLRWGLREVDTLARLDGDEFALLLPSTDAAGAALVASKLLLQLSQPCHAADQEISLTASIGIAVYPDDALEAETMLRCADSAMYRAKQQGRGEHCFYTADMRLRSARQMQLEAGLRRAEERGELMLHYQPQLDLDGMRVVGLEALIRWRHAELGSISPAEFIPLAESTGQILGLGAWVLRTAVRQMQAWIADGLAPRVVAVNLSAIQFKDPGLPELVRGILDEAGLPPACLELELTESVAAGNPEAACAILNRLHGLGVRLSIDDFGTGFSSLNHLKRFPIHTLKIDQSFVRDIGSDSDDRAIVQAIIQMAHAMRLSTIAEGVETIEQADFLRANGCDMVQGYLYCRPQEPAAALAWMQAHELAARLTAES